MGAMSDRQIEWAELFADQLNREFGDCEDDRPFGELVAAAQTFIVQNPTYHFATLRQFLTFIQNEAPTAAWEHITTKSRQHEESKTLFGPEWTELPPRECGCRVWTKLDGTESTLLCKTHARWDKTNEQLEAE